LLKTCCHLQAPRAENSGMAAALIPATLNAHLSTIAIVHSPAAIGNWPLAAIPFPALPAVA